MGNPTIITPGQPGPLRPGEFASGSIPNVATFRHQDLSPPSPLYIQRDDQLLLLGITQLAVDTLTLTARLLLVTPPFTGQPSDAGQSPAKGPAGPGPSQIVTIQRTMTLPANGGAYWLLITLAEGFLLSVNVAGSSTSLRGQTYVRCWINRGPTPTNASNSALALLGDYVTAFHPVGWPYGRNLFPTEGPGNLKAISQANPAAGADFTIIQTAGTRWRIQSLNAQLAIANAGVARIVRVQVKDPTGKLVWQSAAQQTGAINTTVQVSMSGTQVTSVADTTTLNIPLPVGLAFSNVWTIGSSTSNINAADQWSNIALAVEEWIDNL